MADVPHIVLIIGGGIAAYRSLELIRLMRREGWRVTPVLTAAGGRFVTPLSAAALAGEPVHEDLFDAAQEAAMRHITLARAADAIVVAPATANLMARAAAGLADDLATAMLLAARVPVVMAPAMNTAMWEHPATQRNLRQLKADGVRFVGPDEGALACGEEGAGRMAQPEAILAAVRHALEAAERPARTESAWESASSVEERPLSGRHVLVTAGPTHEPLDPVRYIANRSSGRQGFALAAAARDMGARVTLVTGPVHLPCPPGVKCRKVETAEEMLQAVLNALPADVGIFAAAVADWRPRLRSDAKIKKEREGSPPVIELVENPDILATVGHLKEKRPKLVIGFAAETGDPVPAARDKLKRKGADAIVANDVSPDTGILGGTENQVVIVTRDGAEAWPRLTKDDVAKRLMRWIADRLPD